MNGALVLQSPGAAAWAHSLLEYAGIALGMALYRRALRRAAPEARVTLLARGRFALVVGLLAGAALGNKLVFLIERPDRLAAWWQSGMALPLGQSLVGGLLGGLIGLELAKRWTSQPNSQGDAMVFPLTAGIVVGRIGCWLAGLHDDTHGLPTALPWGLDLGDGVLRHPSPLYEIVFLAALAGVLRCAPRAWPQAPGLKFKCWLAAYLAWRLFADGLKPVPVAYPLGLSGIQWVCIVALAFYLPVLGRAWRQSSTLGPAPGPTSSPNQDSTCCKY